MGLPTSQRCGRLGSPCRYWYGLLGHIEGCGVPCPPDRVVLPTGVMSLSITHLRGIGLSVDGPGVTMTETGTGEVVTFVGVRYVRGDSWVPRPNCRRWS